MQVTNYSEGAAAVKNLTPSWCYATQQQNNIWESPYAIEDHTSAQWRLLEELYGAGGPYNVTDNWGSLSITEGGVFRVPGGKYTVEGDILNDDKGDWGRILVAMAPTFGDVGDRVDLYLSDGSTLRVLIADIKNPSDYNYTPWGHEKANGINVIEYFADYYNGESSPYYFSSVTKFLNYDRNVNDRVSQAVGTYTGSGTNAKTYTPRLVKPEADNKYYIRQTAGGWNPATYYDETHVYLNKPYYYAIPNCVGYALGRYNEIIGNEKCSYLFNMNPHDEGQSMWNACINAGYSTGDTPALGAAIIWTGYDFKGSHIAIVEKIHDGNSITISQSHAGEQANEEDMFFEVETLSDYHTWRNSFTFVGFIYNPGAGTSLGSSTSQRDAEKNAAVDGLMSAALESWGSNNIFANVDAKEYLAQQQSKLPKQIKGTSSTGSDVTYESIQTTLYRDKIKHVDSDELSMDSHGTSLLTTPTRVEAPFITVKVGDIVFGAYDKTTVSSFTKINFPNYIKSMNVVKVNGAVNEYTIELIYQIKVGDDPNYIDKVLSKVGYDYIYISYGDCNAPNFIYKEEKALLVSVNSKVDFAASRITYTLKATADGITLLANYFNFPAKTAKPSSVIIDLLKTEKYGLKDIFSGMNSTNYTKYIATDDKEVKLESKQFESPLNYLNYLVSCMCPAGDSDGQVLKSANYYLAMYDDVDEGSYFKIVKVSVDGDASVLNSVDTYEVDVGFPGDPANGNATDNLILNFAVETDNSWSLLYNYVDKINPDYYVNYLDDSGNMVTEYSPQIAVSSNMYKMTSTQKTWWTNMTQFPIEATLTIKGLLRPAMLMTYVKVNAIFYGQKHISSGLYIITKQTDTISGSGYRTELKLQRIAGDTDIVIKAEDTVTTKVPKVTSTS